MLLVWFTFLREFPFLFLMLTINIYEATFQIAVLATKITRILEDKLNSTNEPPIDPPAHA